VDGQIVRQSSSYRQGLVLGLTMAEIMLLLIFCLLIALAAYIRFEKAKLAEAQAVPDQQGISQADRNLIAAIKENAQLYEKLRQAATSSNGAAIDEFWRDLVANQSASTELRKLGLSPEKLAEKLKDVDALQARGVDATTALRDVDVIAAIQSILPNGSNPPDTRLIKETLQKGLDANNAAGHLWPPIIDLSEANGHYFKTGSAELDPRFREELRTTVPGRIVELIKQFDVDVIEVVGHTDEQPIGSRPSNLDQGLVPVLRDGTPIGSLVPADNAGLGLARAVSVVSVLRQSKLLDKYKLIPLSGAQLVNNDETLALTGTPGDIRERRRIEIRLRKATLHVSPIQEAAVPDTAAILAEVPLPRPRPIIVARPKTPVVFPNSPLPLAQP
jgi:flagellar motor protein MotB